eukprot:scaffold55521_cov60-Phaeocystis_antarctica.AAC.1
MPNLTRPDLYRRQSTPSDSVQESSALLLAMARRAKIATPARVRRHVRTREGLKCRTSKGRGASAPAVEAH